MIAFGEEKSLRLLQVERDLRKSLNQFQLYYIRATQLDAATRNNNQIIIPTFIKIISRSFRSLEYMLRFLSDADIMNAGATCRTMYKLVYSPLGYRLIRHLRPVVIFKEQTLEQQIPTFSQSTVDQLCSDKNILYADQDDKMAVLLTMRTNILATKQKIRQLEVISDVYDKKFTELKQNLIYIGGQKQDRIRKIGVIQDDIYKLKELLKASEGHAESLKQSQVKLQMERQTKMLMLNDEKSKLIRQKELLIKKIKSLQKQKEEGMIYSKEVSRVLGRLNQITVSAMGKS